MTMQLIYCPSGIEAYRIKLALGFKQQPVEQIAVAWDDDEPFFDLGLSRYPCVLKDDSQLYTDTIDLLWRIDTVFPGEPVLAAGVIDSAAWDALLQWRESVDDELQRLYAPVLLAYEDIGASEDNVQASKAAIQRQFGVSAESLANARYDLFSTLMQKTRMQDLSRHLAAKRFYMGQPSIADCLLAADLFPLQLMDGVSLPVDLLYYLRRVVEVSGVSMAEHLLVNIE